MIRLRRTLILIFIMVLFSYSVFAALGDYTGIMYYAFEDLNDTGSKGNNFDLESVNVAPEEYVTGVSSGTGNAMSLEKDSTHYVRNFTIDGNEMASIRTVDCWYKSESIGFDQRLWYIKKNSVNYIGAEIQNDGDIAINVWTGVTQFVVLSTNQPLQPGVWAHVILIFGESGVKYYINGVENDTDASTWTIPNDYNQISFGVSQTDDFAYYDGVIDNCFFTNSTYTTDDVAESWNNGNGYNFAAEDTTSPYWIFNSNTTNFTTIATNENGLFGINFTDNTQVDSIIFSRNENNAGWVNETTISNIGASAYSALFNYIITSTRGQTFEWKFYANDTKGNFNETPIWNLVVANSVPKISNLKPESNYHDNKNFTINFTYIDLDNDNGTCDFYIDSSLDTSRSGIVNGELILFNATLNLTGEGKYLWNISCTDTFNTTISPNRTFVLDWTNPNIIWTYPSKDNDTISNENLTLDISCSDENLDKMWVNISNSSGNDIYFDEKIATGTSLTADDYKELPSEDNYTVTITCSDQHTTKTIKDYQTSKNDSKNKLSYLTEEDNNIDIYLESPDDKVTYSTEKRKDRYKFSYDFSNSGLTGTFNFILEADKKIEYIENSQYKAHFIVSNGIKGNWIDFNLDDSNAEYSVTKITDYKYKISITTTETLLDFNSIGGLNVVKQSAIYQYEITPPTYTGDATNGTDLTKTGENVQFNITWFDKYPEQYIFCYGIGSCVNEPAQNYNSGELIIINKTITAVHNQQVYWRFFANDTAGNTNSNVLQSFTIANTPPPAPTSISYVTAIVYTDSLLNCSASGPSDVDGEPITYYYAFKDTDNSTILQPFLPDNNTFNCNISDCDKGDTIYCHAYANDTYNISSEISTGIIIQNKPPEHNNPILNSSFGTNYTNENLTCYAQNTADVDNDDVTNIYNWYRNNQPLAMLNMPFEGGSNSTFTRDYSSYGNDGTVSGANPTNGIIGKAYEFDGVDDTISTTLDFPKNNFTFEMWFKVNEFSSNGRDLFTKYAVGDGFRTLITSSGVIESSWDIGDTFNTLTASITENTWYHFVITYNNSLLASYINGNLIGSEADSGELTTGTNTLILGFNDLGTPNFNGTIDELRVYNRSLTEEQIRALFNNRTDLIVSEETERYDTWKCEITPNDGIVDGIAKNSSLTIKNYPPNAVSLLNPKNNVVLGALPEFNWTSSSDTVDYDDVYYYIQIDNDSDFSSLDYTNKSSINKDINVVLDSTKIEQYYWRVLATDDIDNSSWSDVRTFNYSQWNITFNVTSSKQDVNDLDGVTIINCTYSDFDQAGDTTNMYGPYAFPSGDWICTFIRTPAYYDKTQTFSADSNKIVDVVMPETGGATYQEHTWLEAIYNCIILKDCDLYDLLVQINTTATNIWQHTKPTDESVITSETQISNIYNSSQNISFDYTVHIPIKAGYSLGTYLPVRIGFWFMDENNETCYNQGTLPTGVTLIEPYCNPLMVESLGQMGGNIDLEVNLRPNLSAGTYNIKRIIEIDPNNIWVGYGQEIIGKIIVTEDMKYSSSIDLKKIGEMNPTVNNQQPQTSSSSSGGSSSGGGSSSRVTTPPSEEDISSKDEGKEVPSVTNIYNTYNIIQPEGDKDKEKGGLASITGFIGKFIDGFSRGSPIIGVLMILIIVAGGLMSYFIIKNKY